MIAAPGEPPGVRRLLATSVAGWLVIALAAFGLGPLLPDIALDLAVSPDGLGLALGVGQIVSMALQIPLGVIADRMSPRPLLLGGLALVVGGCVLRAFAPEIVTFALSNALIGVAMPVFQAGSFTGLANVSAGRRLAERIALCFSAFNVGLALSVVVVGALGTQTGWRTALFVLALPPALVVPFAFGLRIARVPHPGVGMREMAGRSLRFLLAPRPRTLALVAIFSFLCGMSNTFVLPFALREQGIDATVTGALLAANVVGSVISAPLLSRLAYAAGFRRTFLGSYAVCAAAVGSLMAFGMAPVGVAIAFFLIGAALGGVGALTQSEGSAEAGRAGVGHGAALSAMRLGQSIGPGVAPTLAGIVYVAAGVGGVHLLSLGAIAAASLALLSIPFPLTRVSGAAHSTEENQTPR